MSELEKLAEQIDEQVAYYRTCEHQDDLIGILDKAAAP